MRPRSSGQAEAAARPVTRPVWFVDIGGGDLRLTSRGPQLVDGTLYEDADIQVEPDNQRVTLFNEQLQFQSFFLSGVSGKRCQIWIAWGEGPFAPADLEMRFDGEVGASKVGYQIRIDLRRIGPLRSPRLYVAPPAFNHLPPAGTEIITPSGITVLQGARS